MNAYETILDKEVKRTAAEIAGRMAKRVQQLN